MGDLANRIWPWVARVRRNSHPDKLSRIATDVGELEDCLDAVRKLHCPVKRYSYYASNYSCNNPEDAAIDTGVDISDVVEFEVCSHCVLIESELLIESENCLCDEDFIGYKNSLWPCATICAIDGDQDES